MALRLSISILKLVHLCACMLGIVQLAPDKSRLPAIA